MPLLTSQPCLDSMVHDKSGPPSVLRTPPSGLIEHVLYYYLQIVRRLSVLRCPLSVLRITCFSIAKLVYSSHHSDAMPRRQIAAGRSCLECRRRKIKCDRSVPCGYCVGCEIRCVYPHGSHQTRRNGGVAEGNVTSRLQTLEASFTTLEQEISQIKERFHVPGGRERQAPSSQVRVVFVLHPTQFPGCDSCKRQSF